MASNCTTPTTLTGLHINLHFLYLFIIESDAFFSLKLTSLTNNNKSTLLH